MYATNGVSATLRDFCCAEAAFMWRNGLLSPRVETDFSAGPEGFWVTFLKGFRVRREFMRFPRDQVLYECPFCAASWVLALGYRDHLHGTEGNLVLTALPKGRMRDPHYRMPRSLFVRALAATKRRCRHWPPQD